MFALPKGAPDSAFTRDARGHSPRYTSMTAIFRTRLAAFLWGFAAVWVTMLIAMTYVVLRDGPPEGISAPMVAIVMCLFWVAGIGLVAFVSTKPSVRPATVVDSRDSDGDPYFFARVNTIDGEPIDITEGHSQPDCEQACEQFNSALYPQFLGRVRNDA